MTPSRSTRIIGWAGAVVLAAALLVLTFYLPVVAAIVFVPLVTVDAVATAQKEGKLKSAIYFLKEILFGW